MNREYHTNWFCKLVILYIFLGSFYLIYMFLQQRAGANVLFLGIIGVPFGALLFYGVIKGRFIIGDNKIVAGITSSRFFNQNISWHEIDRIVFYNFIFIHWYVIFPKGSNWFSTRGTMLSNVVTNYKDALREVVLRTNPDTKVDKYILKKAGLTKEDIGKDYKG